jgi:hypothetical protein
MTKSNIASSRFFFPEHFVSPYGALSLKQVLPLMSLPGQRNITKILLQIIICQFMYRLLKANGFDLAQTEITEIPETSNTSPSVFLQETCMEGYT